MRHSWPFLLLAALLISARAVAAPAPDGDGAAVQQARQHFKAGEKAFNAGNFERALKEFDAGYALAPRPGFLLNMAHTERRLGRLRNARDLYKRYLEADPQSKQRDEVLGLITQLTTTIADEERAESANSGTPTATVDPPAVVDPPVAAPTVSPPPVTATSMPPVDSNSPLLTEVARPAEPTQLVSTPAQAHQDEKEDSESATRPLYQKWWFWGALGAVAAGATLGIVFATRDEGPAFHDIGSLGRLGDP